MKTIPQKSILILICAVFSIFQAKAQYTELTACGTSPLDFPNSNFHPLTFHDQGGLFSKFRLVLLASLINNYCGFIL